MKKIKFWIYAMLLTSTGSAYAGSIEDITVTTPGTLKSLIIDLESVSIDELTIHGSLNGADIAYIISGNGRMANIGKLDIGDVDLVASDEIPYLTNYLIAQSDVGGGGTYGTFYISDTNRREFVKSSSTGLGGDNYFYNVYSNNLEAAFADSKAFKEVVLPRVLTEVGDKMFYCASVENVVIPSSVTCIGSEAFYRTSSLGGIILPDAVERIDDSAFTQSGLTSVTIPASCKIIGAHAFRGCSDLACSVDLSGVEQLGPYAFEYCPLQGTLDLRKLTEIPYGAFTGQYIEQNNRYVYLDKISSVLFSEKLESIGAAAFRETSVKEFNIPSSVKYVGSQAFLSTPWMKSLKSEDGIYYGGTIVLAIDLASPLAKDDAITTLKIKEGTTAIADLYDTRLKTSKFKEVILPSSLRSIGDKCFYNFNKLEKVELLENLEYIGDYAFWNSQSLKGVDFPESLREIGKYAFNRTGLARVMLPDGLEIIGENAFSDCNTITEASLGKNLKSIGHSLFDSQAMVRLTYNTIALGDGLSLYGLSGLEKLIIGNEVTVLPGSFMYGNSNLAIVEFKTGRDEDAILRVESNCFDGCVNAIFKNLPRRLSIGSYAFQDCKNLDINLSDFEITSCNNYAFRRCTGINGTQLTLSDNVEYLGFGLFYEASSPIETIDYNCNVGEIDHTGFFYLPYGSFFDLNRLNRINIGENVEALPQTVFDSCPPCNIYFYAPTPPSVPAEMLGTTSSRSGSDYTLFVPSQLVEEYAAAYAGTELQTFDIKAQQLTLSEETLNLNDGETAILQAIVKPSTTTDTSLLWESSDPAVATVDGDGRVLALTEGQTTVSVSTRDGSSLIATCLVNVTGDASLTDVYDEAFIIEVIGRDIIVKGIAENTPMTLRSIGGFNVAQGSAPCISAPASGFYLLTIGTKTYKVIVK